MVFDPALLHWSHKYLKRCFTSRRSLGQCKDVLMWIPQITTSNTCCPGSYLWVTVRSPWLEIKSTRWKLVKSRRKLLLTWDLGAQWNLRKAGGSAVAQGSSALALGNEWCWPFFHVVPKRARHSPYLCQQLHFFTILFLRAGPTSMQVIELKPV